MFPNSDHLEASSSKSGTGLRITSPIRRDLVPPERSVRFRSDSMFGASVPEAPIDEDCDGGPWKEDVDIATWHTRHRSMYPKAETTPV